MRSWLAFGLGLALLVAGPRLAAADHDSDFKDLTGQLLVAAPHLADPNFAQTVVYLLSHDTNGALGIVVNRPLGEVPLDRLLALLQEGSTSPGKDAEDKGDLLLVFSGGPVEPYRAFTLHSRDVMPERSVPIDDNTAYTVEDDVLRALSDQTAPDRMIFALGYAGWAAGQLEGELGRGDWYLVDADPALVFSAEPGRTWERAVARHGTEL